MYYAPMCCHAYLRIICYQMTVIKAMTLSMTIAALKFLLVQKMDSMVIIYSHIVKMKKFISMKVLLLEKNNKNSLRNINICDEINNIFQYCKKQYFNNPVEILKYLKKNLVQGRPLEIADASQCID